jgi:hypothetical protein
VHIVPTPDYYSLGVTIGHCHLHQAGAVQHGAVNIAVFVGHLHMVGPPARMRV